MMPWRFFTLLLSMTVTVVFIEPLRAQSAAPFTKEVHGLVLSNEGNALRGVHVFSKKHHAGLITDKRGFFHLKTYPDDTLVISHISFISEKLYLSGFKESSVSVVITMKPKIFMLKELTIYADTIAKYLYRKKGTPIVLSPPPVKPDIDVPIGSTNYGPLSHFSKEAKEKRRLLAIYQNEQKDRIYNKTITSDSVRNVFMDRYGLTRKEYDRFLIFFNTRIIPVNPYDKLEIIRQMHYVFLNDWNPSKK